MELPLIFDIKRASTVDGPGIRTAVFLKGCDLDCFWCHNPEGKDPRAEIAFFAQKCAGCGACRRVCPHPDRCSVCGLCVQVCPAAARRLYGKTYTVAALFEILAADAPYYAATGGGVTFSGGECMLYPDYVAAVAARCRAAGIAVAADTAGAVPWRSFEKVLPHVDLFLYDIKALDPALHKRGTGADNALILQNLDALTAAGKRVIVRVPVIPGFNEGAETERIITYCRARGLPVQTLAYHTFGEDKKKALAAAKASGCEGTGRSIL